jgi:hypothetical protein
MAIKINNQTVVSDTLELTQISNIANINESSILGTGDLDSRYPTGTIVESVQELKSPSWLPCTGGVYLKSSYSALSTLLNTYDYITPNEALGYLPNLPNKKIVLTSWSPNNKYLAILDISGGIGIYAEISGSFTRVYEYNTLPGTDISGELYGKTIDGQAYSGAINYIRYLFSNSTYTFSTARSLLNWTSDSMYLSTIVAGPGPNNAPYSKPVLIKRNNGTDSFTMLTSALPAQKSPNDDKVNTGICAISPDGSLVFVSQLWDRTIGVTLETCKAFCYKRVGNTDSFTAEALTGDSFFGVMTNVLWSPDSSLLATAISATYFMHRNSATALSNPVLHTSAHDAEDFFSELNLTWSTDSSTAYIGNDNYGAWMYPAVISKTDGKTVSTSVAPESLFINTLIPKNRPPALYTTPNNNYAAFFINSKVVANSSTVHIYKRINGSLVQISRFTIQDKIISMCFSAAGNYLVIVTDAEFNNVRIVKSKGYDETSQFAVPNLGNTSYIKT